MNLALRLHLLLFPPACWRCRRLLDPLSPERPGYPFLCAECHAALGWWEPERSCRRCGRWTAEPEQERCQVCAEEAIDLDGVLAAARYDDPVSHWIRILKYHRQDSLAPLLGRLLAESPVLATPRGRAALAEAHWAMPVPLHPRRIRARGFNQAHLLARQLLAHLRRMGWAAPPLRCDLLRRHRHTRPQVEMSRAERYTNVAGAFSVVPPSRRGEGAGAEPVAPHPELAGRAVVLIDDVMTTGATLNACARTLKAAGACAVTALVLARL